MRSGDGTRHHAALRVAPSGQMGGTGLEPVVDGS